MSGPTFEPAELEPAILEEPGDNASRGSGPDGSAMLEPTGTRISPDLERLAVPIGRYTRHPENPRRHPHLDELRASYRRFGQYRAIVVQASTGYIVAGNGLHEVMETEGAAVIAANVLELDDREAEALLLADNRLADKGTYDQEAIARLLDHQDATGDLVGIGYTTDDLDRLMRDLGTGKTEVDDAPPLPREEPRVQLGELWELGDHRLFVGDATDPASWARLMGDVQADLVWTDPPYGVGYYGKTAEHLRIEGDEPNRPALEELLDAAFELAVRYTKPGRGVYCASPGGLQSMTFLRVLERHGIYRQTIVWVKDVFVMGRSDYHYRHELVQAGATPDEASRRAAAGHDAKPGERRRRPRRADYKEAEPVHYGWRPGGAHWFSDDRTMDTVWEFDRPKASRQHPTMKPVGLIERSILASTRRGELVVDFFAGSGSTIIAAETTRRRCAAMDIDPRYAQVCIDRWEAFTGRTARRLDA